MTTQRYYSNREDYEARNNYVVVVRTMNGREIDKAFATRKAAENHIEREMIPPVMLPEVMTRRQFAALR